MDSFNTDKDTSVVRGADQDSYVEADSIYAKAPPLAASTEARTRARRHLHADNVSGSFLDEFTSRCSPVDHLGNTPTPITAFSAADAGARPKTHVSSLVSSDSNTLLGSQGTGQGNSTLRNGASCRTAREFMDGGDLPTNPGNPCDWSDYDGQSSLGILNVDDMDLSETNLLTSPRDMKSQQDSLKTPTPGHTNDSQQDSQCLLKDQRSTEADSWKFDGCLSSGSQNSQPENQLFARSQLGTVKKTEKIIKDPMVHAIKQSLFGQSAAIGEEAEDGDASVYNVELEVQDLHDLDDEFGEMVADSDEDQHRDPSPEKQPQQYGTVSLNGEELQLDSIYLRPGTTGEEQARPKLTYLSKVSLFDVGSGSGSEMDTEDELELARKAQGVRQEAAGEASQQDTSRPGVEGEDEGCITQRQSAEGDVVTSPVPGDGGGGGDGSSGDEGDDGQGSSRPGSTDLGYHGNMAAHLLSFQASAPQQQQQEQRIRPMGDDLLSELRFSKYAVGCNSKTDEDTRLSSRYFNPNSHSDDDDDGDTVNQPAYNVDDFLGSTVDGEFDPGNRLEASGFNADDLSALMGKGPGASPFDQSAGGGNMSNPFDVKVSSFGSFGLEPPRPDSVPDLSQTDDGKLGLEGSSARGPETRRTSSTERQWVEFHMNSSGNSTESAGLGAVPRLSGEYGRSAMSQRTAASGRPSRNDEVPFSQPDMTNPVTSTAHARHPTSTQPSHTTSQSSSAHHPTSPLIGQPGREGGAVRSRSGDTSTSQEKVVTDPASKSWDDHMFQKPTLPAPKAANFSKSVGKSGSSRSSSKTSHSSSGGSGLSGSKPSISGSGGAAAGGNLKAAAGGNVKAVARDDGSKSSGSGRSSASSYVDLALRASFTGTSEQTEGLAKLDQVLGDESFFGNDDALAMLDQDEVDFKKENIFIQEDAMKPSGQSPEDSWALRSFTSIARPSWLEASGDEEQVRISMGTYMRGRTEALGSLDGDEQGQRPDFGMLVKTPPSRKPHALLHGDEMADTTRTSGVGEQDYATPVKSPEQSAGDTTLTEATPKQRDEDSLSITGINLKGLGLTLNNETLMNKYNPDEISMLLNQTKSPFSLTTDGLPTPVASAKRSSHLPVKKGSTVNRSFARVRDSDVLKQSTGPGGKKPSVTDSNVKKSPVPTEDLSRTEAPAPNAVHVNGNITPPPGGSHGDELWASPNTSSCCPSTACLLDRLEEFKFSSRAPSEKSSRGEVLKDTTNVRHNTSSIIDHGYMPGHHIPDGTAYSQRSDYAHMDHSCRGESREDVAGVDDVGLAESRGFDVLKGTKSHSKHQTLTSDKGNSVNDNQTKTQRHESTNHESQRDTSEWHNNNKLAQERHSLHVKPAFSKSPSIKPVENHRRTSADSAYDPQMDHDTTDSSTQTSTVLKESVGYQINLEDMNDKHKQNHEHNSGPLDEDLRYNKTMETSEGQLKQPMSSFKHNLLPNSASQKSHVPSLLTNQSLMKTDFAESNLKQGFSIEILENIYSKSRQNVSRGDHSNVAVHRNHGHTSSHGNVTSHSNHGNMSSLSNMTSADWKTMGPLDGRESLESQAHWQQLMESVNVTDFPRLSEIPHRDEPFPSCAQSTPHPHSEGKFSEFLIPGRPSDISHNFPDSTSKNRPSDGRSKVCVVEAPGVLKFSESCCVGISRKEVLPLSNPTDGWIECILKPRFLEVDGRTTNLGDFPFEMREKIIIEPQKTVGLDVLFLPKVAGAYVAQLQVFSTTCMKKGQLRHDAVPVNVTFQALAEEPCVKVYCDDQETSTVDFGELTWGSCIEKSIRICNKGHANLPLRVAITSNGAWHCFCFEPEGRMSEVSIISGSHAPSSQSGRSIINISLAPVNDPFSCHEVRVWCRPPDKQNTNVLARRPPELFRCTVNVEVDTPCSRVPRLHAISLLATVGVKKLHIHSNLKEIVMKTKPKKAQVQTVAMYNAGNISLTALLQFTEHRDMFYVTPATLELPPHTQGEIDVTFHPHDATIKQFISLLLMMVKPDGPVFELQVSGTVAEETMAWETKLQYDRTKVEFGGVAIGSTCVKRYGLKNTSTEAVGLRASVETDSILLARSPETSAAGSRVLDLTVEPKKVLYVYVRYCPVRKETLAGKITMRPIDKPSLKYTVKFFGYGGVSELRCSDERNESRTVRGCPCVSIERFSISSVKEVYVRNMGNRCAVVNVAVFTELGCTERLTGLVSVQPSMFVLGEGEHKRLEVGVSMTEEEFWRRETSCGVAAALRFSYKDMVEHEKPHESQVTVGLVRSHLHRTSAPNPGLATPNPGLATPTRSTVPLKHWNDKSPRSDSGDLTSRSINSTASSTASRPDDGWTLKPNKMVIYCSSRGSNDTHESFFICNNKHSGTIRYDIMLPQHKLYVSTGNGVIKAGDTEPVKVYASVHVINNLRDLPWSGQIFVNVDGHMKSIQVELRRDMTPLTHYNLPEQAERGLVPLPTSNTSQFMPGTGQTGSLKVSSTVVQFPTTKTGKTSEQTLVLTNIGTELCRWLFTSFAPPYLRKKGGGVKETFRVSYRVFDFSKQFGKLPAKESIQLVLQFQPKSTGLFSQYWDVQTSGDTAPKDNILRIHLTGEGIQDAEVTTKNKVDIENLLPELTSGSSSGLRLSEGHVRFPCVRRGESVKVKTELKNGHNEDISVAVTSPYPPFYVRHNNIKIMRRKYLRLPIEFHPTRAGVFTDTVRFQGSKGENLVLEVTGECR